MKITSYTQIDESNDEYSITITTDDWRALKCLEEMAHLYQDRAHLWEITEERRPSDVYYYRRIGK